MKNFKFSIYDYNNRLTDLLGTGGGDNKIIFTGPHENEMKYGYMRPGFDINEPATWPSGGGSAGKPYYAEFRVQPLASGAYPTNVTFTVKGAKAKWNGSAADGEKWEIETAAAGGAEVWHDIGVLHVEEIEEATPYRIAFSDNKYKFFKVEVTPASAEVSAFLMRG